MEGLSISLFFTPAYSEDLSLSMAKQVLLATQGCAGMTFRPLLPDDAALLTADRNEAFESLFTPLMLVHTDAAGQPELRINISQARNERVGWAVMGCDMLFLSTERAIIEKVWRFSLALAPRLVAAVSPIFSEIHGIGESGIRLAQLKARELPPVIGPWNYLSDALLGSGHRAMLESIPSCQTRPLHHGISLQPVADLYTKPTAEFTASLSRLGTSKPIQYHDVALNY